MGWLPVPRFPRDDDIDLKAKSGKALARFFPEMVAVLARLPQTCFVLDGELTIVTNGEFSFDALLARLHRAETRIRLLSTRDVGDFHSVRHSARCIREEPNQGGI